MKPEYQTVDPVKMGEIPSQIMTLQESVGTTIKKLDELVARLYPVLTLISEDETSSPIKSFNAPLAQEISEITERVRYANDKITSLLTGLQV